MSVNDLDEAFCLIEKKFDEGEKYFGTPCNDIQIKKAESDLGIIFPPSYKVFVSKHGYGGVNSLDIDGVADFNFQNSGYGGVVWNVLDRRKNFSLPHPIIPIYNLGNGDTYCLDTSQMNEEGECPVVVWPIGGYEQTPILEIVAEDFGAFFLDMVRQQIAYKQEE